ncbi:MAG: MMPL family transporter, partial [Pseudomonadota bacterium]
ERVQRVYTKDDNVMFVIKPAGGDVFTRDVLSAVRGLTEESWTLPFSTRVDSVTNFQNSVAQGLDDLIVADLVPADSPLDAADLERIRDAALSEPLVADRLVSPDAETIAVNVTMTLPQLSSEEAPSAVAAARLLMAEYQAQLPDARFALTGSIALNNAFSEASQNDLSFLIPLMYAGIAVVAILLLRSVTGVFATVVVIALSTATAMGVGGWFGVALTPPSAIAPTIITTLAVADSIHLLITALMEMRRGADKRTAIERSLVVNFQPILLTSVTTSIGFLTLNFSDAPPFHDLGNLTATGVMAAWVFSIATLPALIAILPFGAKPARDGETHRETIAEKIGDFVIARRRALLPGMAAVTVVLVALVPQLELNDQFVAYFDESITFRTDTDFAMENLTGINQAQWSLPAGESGGVQNPDYLQAVDDFSNWLRAQDGVVHVQTMTDIFKRLNKNMHADDEAWYRLPDSRELAAQYLLLFEFSLPYGLDLNNQIDVDKSSFRITATLENITTQQLRTLDEAASAWLGENLPTGEATRATGAFVLFAYISERNIKAMLTGTLLAFILISLLLGFALRSVKMGLISLAPNLFPAFMAFGVWAMAVGEIGLASSVITATALGIIVDDTVHFLSKYQRARRLEGADAVAAVRYAFSTVGTALWVMTVVLVAGFGILSLSAFEINKSLGLLTALSLTIALVVDFLLLPPLLIALDGDGDKSAAPVRAQPAPAE